jgi:hypothetical protein
LPEGQATTGRDLEGNFRRHFSSHPDNLTATVSRLALCVQAFRFQFLFL